MKIRQLLPSNMACRTCAHSVCIEFDHLKKGEIRCTIIDHSTDFSIIRESTYVSGKVVISCEAYDPQSTADQIT